MREDLLGGTFTAPQAGTAIPLAGRETWDVVAISSRFLQAGSATVVIESGVADDWQTVHTFPVFSTNNQRETTHIGGSQAPNAIKPGETDLRANLTAVTGEVVLGVSASTPWLDPNDSDDQLLIRNKVEEHADRSRIVASAERIVLRYLTRTVYQVPVNGWRGAHPWFGRGPRYGTGATYPFAYPAVGVIEDTPQTAELLRLAVDVGLPGFGQAMKLEIAAQASYTVEMEGAACAQDPNAGNDPWNATDAYPDLGRYVDPYTDREARGWIGRG